MTAPDALASPPASAASPARMRALIVDDEPLARRGLELRLAAYPDVEIVGQCGDGASAIVAVHRLQPDLMFLDVQMPGADGFETLREIPAGAMPLVVFVTAFDHFALRAFETSAVDYLLKPVNDARLEQALARARDAMALRASGAHCEQLLRLLGELGGREPFTLDEALDAAQLRHVRRDQRLVVREGGRVVRIDPDTLRWIDAAGDYMCVHTDGETLVLRATLGALEKQLDASRFARIHRSTIVNLRRVVELRPHTNGESFLRLDCGHELKLSRNYRDKLQLLL